MRREDVAAAFVAALRPRRYAHWSSLVSFALGSTLPKHAFRELPGRRTCAVCGAYARVDVFPSDRFAVLRETGTVGIASLRYTAFDLAAFARDEIPQPDEADRRFFNFAVARIAALPPEAKTFAAERAVGMMFSSRVDRKLFLGVLGACGVLANPTHPGFWPDFTAFEDRARLDPTPYTYPVAWWQRGSGDARAALHAFGLDAYLSAETLAAFARAQAG